MKYKIVDKEAPRFTRTQFQTKLVIKDLHGEFVDKTGIQIDYKTFKTLYERNMDVIKDFIVTERNGVVLPVQMGNIHLAFFKMKRRMYNYMYGWTSGEAPVNHQFNSEGLPGKIFWDYKDVKYKPRDYRLCGFKACRQLTQAASRAFTNTPELFRKYLYKTIERSKASKMEKNECNNQGSNQPVENASQGSQL